MIQSYFIKFTPKISKITGCPRAALIFGCLEYWSSKKPEGFYKFIEPCAHRLYKGGDSWTEELSCDPKSFAKSFLKIGVKYTSRTEFEKAPDKFQGKFYASYYDRYSNRTFFIRNHEVVDTFLAMFPTPKTTKRGDAPKPAISPKKIDKISQSSKDSGNTSSDLPSGKSPASNETIQKMVKIWETAIEGGKRQIELTGRRIAFLKKALEDKFGQLVENWEEFCRKIASSKFLMGEKTSFKATLDWALKFDNIQKILEGNYGIGDRAPTCFFKNNTLDLLAMREGIAKLDETEEARGFRVACLENFGVALYQSWFQKLDIQWNGQEVVTLIAPTKFHADCLGSRYQIDIKNILGSLGFGNSLRFAVAGGVASEVRETTGSSITQENNKPEKQQAGQQSYNQDGHLPILPTVHQLKKIGLEAPPLEAKQPILVAERPLKTQRVDAAKPAVFQQKFQFSIRKFSRSYKDAKNPPNDLSKDKSHAGNGTVQKMMEVWNTTIGNGRQPVELTTQRIALLSMAWEDKFNQSLENWQEFCQKIASSKFLMGEKTFFKATLDWALKFANIEKILEGVYGLDRTPTCNPGNNATELPVIREMIQKSEDPDGIKDFKFACLERLGSAIYQSWFQKLDIEFDGKGSITLIAPTRFHADCLEKRYQTEIKNILASLGAGDSLLITVAGESEENPAVEAGKAANKPPVRWRNGKGNLSFPPPIPKYKTLGFITAELNVPCL